MGDSQAPGISISIADTCIIEAVRDHYGAEFGSDHLGTNVVIVMNGMLNNLTSN